MAVEIGLYNDYQDCWGLSHNDFHKAYRAGSEYIQVELNSTNPPTVKQYSAFQLFQESSATLLATASGNNVYPASTSMAYFNAQAIFEDGGNRTFTFGTTSFPSPSTGTYYLECRSADDVSSTSRGLGNYFTSTLVPTLDKEKGAYYNANGRVLASFSVNSTDIDSLHIYNINFPREDGTVNQVMQTDGAGTLSWGGIVASESVVAKSTDYVITDGDGYTVIVVDASAQQVLITAPTLAANQNRMSITILNGSSGIVRFEPEGSETINGSSHIELHSDGDKLQFVATASEWKIMNLRSKIETGFVRRSDWTNVHIGTPTVTFDNGVGSFQTGETVQCTSTGSTTVVASGIIMTATTTVLTLRSISSTGSTTLFPDNFLIEGVNSAATGDVNGDTKNTDDDFYHGIGVNIKDIKRNYFVSSDGEDNNSFEVFTHDINGPAMTGVVCYQIDTDNFKLQTGAAGIRYAEDDGTGALLDTEDWYYNVNIERIL